MEWARLVELVGRVRATSKKSEKVALIAELLRQARGREAELAALYLTGSLPQGRIGVGWRTLEPAMPSGPALGDPLTLRRVDEALSAVATETGPGSAERRLRALRALLEATDEPGRRLLVELLLGEVRQGALQGLVIEAIARAASLAPADVRAAAMYAPSLGELARKRFEETCAGSQVAGLEQRDDHREEGEAPRVVVGAGDEREHFELRLHA